MHPGQYRPPAPGYPGAPVPPGGVPRRDPFGLGGQPGVPPQQARPMAPAHAPVAQNLEAILRDALPKASRELIEKIAWEVVPQLAETIIREELERLIKEREQKH
jgi:hypothetical protein